MVMVMVIPLASMGWSLPFVYPGVADGFEGLSVGWLEGTKAMVAVAGFDDASLYTHTLFLNMILHRCDGDGEFDRD